MSHLKDFIGLVICCCFANTLSVHVWRGLCNVLEHFLILFYCLISLLFFSPIIQPGVRCPALYMINKVHRC